ncbi:DUF6966 domain-containing protein [Rhizobium sp. BR 315]|uniref:DUF6966 domain-containing protein n=1 Tax=Rhizobium sp. BR 315 TaxID=3040014 RepID=UPI003D338E0A
MKLHPDVSYFADLLRRIENHLARYEEAQWAAMIGSSRASVERSDTWGVYSFLAMFGGMGSLRDLVLQHDGMILTAESDELYEMLGEAWELGTRLKREETAARNSANPPKD